MGIPVSAFFEAGANDAILCCGHVPGRHFNALRSKAERRRNDLS